MSTNFPIRNLKFSISIGELAGRLKAGFINVIMPKKADQVNATLSKFSYLFKPQGYADASVAF